MVKQDCKLMKPKVDFCFKEIMKDDYVRLGFISAILKLRPEEIESTILLPTILEKRYEDDYSCFHLREDTSHALYTDKMEIHILELPKLKKNIYPEADLLNWARFFCAEEKEEFEEMAEKNGYIQKAYETLQDISADELKRLEYDAREKAIRDHISFIKYSAEEGRKAGMEDGRKEGRKEGIKEGLKEGLREGIMAMILDNLEEGKNEEKILSKLVRRFSLEKEEAKKYFDQCTAGDKQP